MVSTLLNKIISEIIKTNPLTCITHNNLFTENDQLKTNTALRERGTV